MQICSSGGNNKKKVTVKNCAPFTTCISEINNTQVDNSEDTDIVMPVYNLIEYTDNYLNTSEVCRNTIGEPSLNNNSS